MDLEFRQIRHGSPEYAEEVALRDRVLRKPLGLSFSREDLAAEAGSVHLGAYRADRLIAVLILARQDAQIVRMRQVAVATEAQGQGVGKKLVAESEAIARRLGFTQIHLHARMAAVPFYRALGYAGEGATFTEVGIEHQEMRKSL